jgi:hypothetical protein
LLYTIMCAPKIMNCTSVHISVGDFYSYVAI